MKQPTRRGAAAQQTSDRRTRLRLRELCDEVLASFRAARGDELFAESDRAAARALLPQVAGR